MSPSTQSEELNSFVAFVSIVVNKKIPSTQWDGRDVSRGTTQINHAHPLRLVIHLVLTNISFSCNVENTARTTW